MQFEHNTTTLFPAMLPTYHTSLQEDSTFSLRSGREASVSFPMRLPTPLSMSPLHLLLLSVG